MDISTFDIVGYLEYLSVDYWEEGSKNVSRGWVGIQCPFCDDDHNHLGINLNHKNFTCWKCKESGSLINLIQTLEEADYNLVRDRIDQFQTYIPYVPEGNQQSPITDHALPYDFKMGLSGMQKSYLKERRFDPLVIQTQWRLMRGPVTGKWKYRIIVPVYSEGNLMTWVGLDPTGARDTKYLNATVEESIIPTSQLIYGTDQAGDSAIIVEGVTDAWRLGPGALATLGMGITATKIEALLYLKTKTFYIMFDAEYAAQKNADILGDALALAGRNVEVIHLANGDPADLTEGAAAIVRGQLIGD